MFRKSSKKRPIKLRRKEEDDDDEEEEFDNNNNVQAKIRQTQKKQKLLSSLPVTTGNVKKRTVGDASTAAPQQLSSSSQGELSVLAKKHQQAMEEFIDENLQPNKGEDQEAEANESTELDSQAALYQELADATVKSQLTQDDDKGAVLVGGTGIAEVVLPSQQRQKNDTRVSKVKNKNLGSSSAVPTDTLVHLPATTQTPSIRSMTSTGPSNKLMDPVKSTVTPAAVEEPQPQEDDNRMGFAAYRGMDKKARPKTTPAQKSKRRDDQAFSKFIKRQHNKRWREFATKTYSGKNAVA